MPFRIIRNDITRVEADAIVNTADPLPCVGGGTDWAVHQAAGPELLAARERIGEIEVGCARATPAFGLPARYVLHTVSPVWVDGRHGEEAQLRKAYDAALSLAGELGCRSVAFPLLSAGACGFPQELALATAIRAFTDFLMDHEMQIELVLFNARAFGVAGSLFDDLKSYVDDNYVCERSEREYGVDAAAAQEPELRRLRRTRARRAPCEEPAGRAGVNRPAAPKEAAAARTASSARPPLSLEDVLRQHEKSFSEHLLDLLRERGGKDSEVYKRAEVSKQLFSKILNNRAYQPTKSTAIQLAVGLQLDLVQTQKLLETAGYALTRSSKADLVVQYCIEHGYYSVSFINEALYDCGLPLLKTGLKA